jgi:membrane protease subunit (stomatin/prohibitin family)
VSRLNDFLGEFVDSLFELPKSYDEIGVAVKTRLAEDFRKYGMELLDFYLSRITPPEDVQKMIDERSSMGAVGDLDKFLKFKAAEALGDAAAGGGAGGGEAAAGLGLGVGAGMGMMIPGMLYKALGAAPTQVAERGVVNCPECHGEVTVDSRFCPHCGHQMVVIKQCARCGKNITTTARFCPSCGLDVSAAPELRCPHCQTALPPGTRFCLNCGERVAQ